MAVKPIRWRLEGVALEKCLRELGANLESERISVSLYEPLPAHNLEMPAASVSQQSSDTLSARVISVRLLVCARARVLGVG